MPHLSPMNWLMSPILFLMVALPIIIASLWWTQMPVFPHILKKSHIKHSSTLWNWN